MTNKKEVNAALPRINIRGKEYVTVANRIQGFWQLYPEGAIVTELLEDDGKKCLFRATAYNGERVLSTGHAYELQGRGVNATSYIENAETSAIGRALGILGIGSVESVASADEVTNAQAQQVQQAQKYKAPAAQEPCQEWYELVATIEQYVAISGVDKREAWNGCGKDVDRQNAEKCKEKTVAVLRAIQALLLEQKLAAEAKHKAECDAAELSTNEEAHTYKEHAMAADIGR